MFVWNDASFSFLTGTALKSTVVLSAAWVVVLLLRKRSAAARHLVWVAAVAALLALPLLSVSMPALRVPISSSLVPSVFSFQVTAAAPSAHSAASQSPSAFSRDLPSNRGWQPGWGFMVLFIWAAGAVAAFAQMLLASARASWMRTKAKPLHDPDFTALAESIGLHHHVDLLETPSGTMPMTFGVFRPAVLVPAAAATWTDDRRRMVLLHELAHIHRGDVTLHLMARAALSVYWWNPLCWFAWRELLKERERATDDLVLGAGTRASDYAGHLLEIARSMQAPAPVSAAAIAMAQPSQLEDRLSAILDDGRRRRTQGRTPEWIAALMALTLAAPLAVLRAEPQTEAKSTRQELEAALAQRAATSNQSGADYAQLLIQMGDLERNERRPLAAEPYYLKALEALGDRPESSRALMGLAFVKFVAMDWEVAYDYFEKAQIADSSIAGSAKMWMALVRERQQKLDEAEFLYRSALALQKEGSPAAATTMELLARLLRDQQKYAEADSLTAQIATIRKPAVFKPAADVYKIGAGVSAPQLILKQEPEYTDEARAAAYQGTVVLAVEIGTDGVARNMQIVRGLGLGLNEKAMEAIGKWRFKPGMKDGQPVVVSANIEVNWRLQ